MSERLVVALGADGRVRAHTEGMLGTHCLGAVPLLEDLLAAVAVESSYTADFHRTAIGQQSTSAQTQQERA